jgi:hypothetical protein
MSGKHASDAPDLEVAFGVVIEGQREVGNSLEKKGIADGPSNMFGGDEAIGGDGGPAESAGPASLILPTAVGESLSSGRSGVEGRVGGGGE